MIRIDITEDESLEKFRLGLERSIADFRSQQRIQKAPLASTLDVTVIDVCRGLRLIVDNATRHSIIEVNGKVVDPIEGQKTVSSMLKLKPTIGQFETNVTDWKNKKRYIIKSTDSGILVL